MKKLALYFSILCLFVNCSGNSNLSITKEGNSNFSKTKEVLGYYINAEKNIEKKIVTTDMLKDFNYPIILVETDNIIKQMLLLPMTQRENYFNYTSGSGQSLTMQGALVTKTNGFNAYLISAKANENSPLTTLTKIVNWPLEDVINYSFITPDFQFENIKVKCKNKFSSKENVLILENKILLNKVKQRCSSKKGDYDNYYWVNDDGTIVKSEQYLIYPKIFIKVTKVKN